MFSILLRILDRIPYRVRGYFLALVLLIGTVLVYTGIRVDRFVTREPRAFCTSCHQIESTIFDNLYKDKHRFIACGECHTLSRKENLRLLLDYSFARDEALRGHLKTDLGSCNRCHNIDTAEMRMAGEESLHRLHLVRANLTCLNCHPMDDHFTATASNNCGKCHIGKQVLSKGMGQFACIVCHKFQKTRGDSLPGREDCLSCHMYLRGSHELSLDRPDAPMHMDCNNCHKPHLRPTTQFTERECLVCHAIEIKMGPQEKAFHPDCLTCHKPHNWKAPNSACSTCHKTISKRPEHKGTAHLTNCIICHTPHDFGKRVDKNRCDACHKPANVSTPVGQLAGHRDCGTCHTPDTWAFKGEETCQSCHNLSVSPLHKTLDGQNCLSCHRPHTWKSEKDLCIKCHKQILDVELHSVIAHRRCKECHQPHTLSVSPQESCSSCHFAIKHKEEKVKYEPKDCANCHKFSPKMRLEERDGTEQKIQPR